MKNIYLIILFVLVPGCSVFGNSVADIAPYQVINADANKSIELRYYDQLILVSTPMAEGIDSNRNNAFYKLFKYISGSNLSKSEVSIATPVLHNENSEGSGVKIPMTAPVFMDISEQKGFMAFVLPQSYTLDTVPKPKDPDLDVSAFNSITFAVIRFSGLLNAENIKTHREILEQWIKGEGLEPTGSYMAAGYNPPFTIPALRRNEVLIPVIGR